MTTTRTSRTQCPWDWSSDRASRSRADKLHALVAMWAEPYEQEPPRETDEKEFNLIRLTEIRKIEEYLAEARAENVRDARRYGATWDEVGTHLGITRQAAQMRFGEKAMKSP